MTDRSRARALARESIEQGDAVGWFERLYAEASRGDAVVPWADLAPNPHVVEWLEREAPAPGCALDVGTGLGDTAEDLAGRGFDVVAFDVSPTAVTAARRRFPNSRVAYRVADLLQLPADFAGAFDLVIECYTLQVLPPAARSQAIASLRGTLAPGGSLLVVARGREPGASRADAVAAHTRRSRGDRRRRPRARLARGLPRSGRAARAALPRALPPFRVAVTARLRLAARFACRLVREGLVERVRGGDLDPDEAVAGGGVTAVARGDQLAEAAARLVPARARERIAQLREPRIEQLPREASDRNAVVLGEQLLDLLDDLADLVQVEACERSILGLDGERQLVRVVLEIAHAAGQLGLEGGTSVAGPHPGESGREQECSGRGGGRRENARASLRVHASFIGERSRGLSRPTALATDESSDTLRSMQAVELLSFPCRWRRTSSSLSRHKDRARPAAGA